MQILEKGKVKNKKGKTLTFVKFEPSYIENHHEYQFATEDNNIYTYLQFRNNFKVVEKMRIK